MDFADPVNQFTAATALVIGIADFTFTAGDAVFNGIARLRGTATPVERPATGRAAAGTPVD